MSDLSHVPLARSEASETDGVLGDEPVRSRWVETCADLVAGVAKSWIWVGWATQDIKLRYRGSMLGPFWLTISTVVMIMSMGLIYAKIFHTDISSYFPFLTVGLI